MLRLQSVRSRKEARRGSSPDPRTRVVRRPLFERHRKTRKNFKLCLGKIAEEKVESSTMGNQEEPICMSDSENESLIAEEKQPLLSELPAEEEMANSSCILNETASDHSASSSSPPYSESDVDFDLSTVDRDKECSYSSPEQVREDPGSSSSSPFYCESYDDFDFNAFDREEECSYSSPEQVRKDDSLIQSKKTAFGQSAKNSTLMEMSRAQAINDISGPLGISNISPSSEDCSSESNRCHLDQLQLHNTSILVPGLIREVSCPEESNRSLRNGEYFLKDCASASTLISGKLLCKIRKDDKYGSCSATSKPCASTTSKAKFPGADAHPESPVNRPTHKLSIMTKPLSSPGQPTYLPPHPCLDLVCPPEPVTRTMKRVHFCDPPATEISDLPDDSSSCIGSELLVPPTIAEASAILKEMSTTTNEMFLHHPMLRLLEKSDKRYF